MNDVKKSFNTDRVFFIFLWTPYAFLTYCFRWICDDAFISFRYALNFASGSGLRYNPGDHIPVEGYSNFLWVLLCSFFEYCRFDITLWPMVVSFLCGSILLYLVFKTLHHRLKLGLAISCVAALFLGCSPPFVIWSTSGLETVPFALLLFIVFERLVLKPDTIAPVAAGAAGLALAYMRVDGIYWAVLLALTALLSRSMASQKYMRGLLVYLIIVLAGYAVYWLLRYHYYQLPFANTAYVKIGMGAAALKRGFNYAAVQYLTVVTLFIIIPGAVAACRKSRLPIGLPVALIPAVATLYAVAVSGDFMPMGRFLVPGLACNALLFGWILKDLLDFSVIPEKMVIALGLLVIIIGALPLFDIHLTPQTVRERFHFRFNSNKYTSEYDRWIFGKHTCRSWAETGRALKAYADPSGSVVAKGIGALGYYSGLYIYDQGGLVNRDVVQAQFDDHQLKSPGHDKMVPLEFFFDKHPDIILPAVVTESKLRRAVVKYKNSELAALYAPDVTPLPRGREISKAPGYLFVLKRIEEGTTPQSAWDKADRLLSAL